MNNQTKPKVRRTTEEVLSEIVRPAKQILFLSRILRWWPHAKRHEAGKFWIYKSRKEWTEEIGAELKTFEGYITQLRKSGWIETAAFERFIKDDHRYGEKIQHVRPTDKLIKFVEDGTGRTFERPKKFGLNATAASPQISGGPPLKNEGHPPSKMRDHKKENSSLSKHKHKNQHEGIGTKANASPEYSKKIYGKEEGNPSGHPGSVLTPKPLGSDGGMHTRPIKPMKKFCGKGPVEDIADPLDLL